MTDGLGARVMRPRQGVGRRAFVASMCAAAAGSVVTAGGLSRRSGRLPPQVVWTASDFEPLVGTWFEVVDPVHTDGRLRLESVTEIGRPGAGGPSGRAPFSLVFTGRTDGSRDQATCRLRHRTAGDMTLLLVPIGGTATTIRLEAVVG